MAAARHDVRRGQWCQGADALNLGQRAVLVGAALYRQNRATDERQQAVDRPAAERR